MILREKRSNRSNRRAIRCRVLDDIKAEVFNSLLFPSSSHFPLDYSSSKTTQEVSVSQTSCLHIHQQETRMLLSLISSAKTSLMLFFVLDCSTFLSLSLLTLTLFSPLFVLYQKWCFSSFKTRSTLTLHQMSSLTLI